MISRLLISAALLAVSAPVVAQELVLLQRPQLLEPGQAAGRVGAAALFGTEYAGSDQRDNRLMPGIDYQWGSGWFAGTTLGVGYAPIRTQTLQAGLRLTPAFGRDESDSLALRGLGDIGNRIEWGGFVTWAPAPAWLVGATLRLGGGQDRDGALLDLGASRSWSLTANTRFSASAGLTVANGSWMNDWYGINAVQSARSGYGVYSAGAGLRDWRLGVSLQHSLSDRTSLFAGLTLNTLAGDARNSPITRDDRWVSGIAGVFYRF